MAFEDVMGAVMRWTTATEALAAVGAHLSLLESGDGSPEVIAALQAVSEAAGLGDLAELGPQQRSTIAAIVRLYLRQSIDLLDNAAAPPGWAYTDPTILDGMYKVTLASAPMDPLLDAKGLETADQLNVEAGFLRADQKLASYEAIFTNEYVK